MDAQTKRDAAIVVMASVGLWLVARMLHQFVAHGTLLLW